MSGRSGPEGLDGRGPGGTSGAFAHPALFYRHTRDYLDGLLRFVREGLAAGEPVAVAVPGENLRLVREGLGPDADAVRLLDMREAGRNPGRIIPGVLRAFADAQPPGRRVRIVGEPIWAGRTAVEYPACVQHEALINAAFAGRAVTILCPYDVRRLDARVLADACATHPTVIHGGWTADSGRYAPDTVVARYNRPLPAPPEACSLTLPFGSGSLAEARHRAADEGARLGLTPARAQDLMLAAAELTTNSVVHGGGAGVLRVWGEDGTPGEHGTSGAVVCEVRDSGLLADSLAGRRPAPPDQRGGRGLLLVNMVADLVRMHTGRAGTTVRCWFGAWPSA
ncbi:anti-sigma regulatory factor [Streptomyces sp. Act143]|uniref:sensor histidine kinase n=1 Tax=Streptomyces sp. Act143 TaxID=2200760 RepID=UPI000D67EF26|nr:sensor histidine kinase [Streptomyces sp. Act143]PWI18576.1 anti-sigma regulatory factor [Streptomyces sp. Act143]